MVLVALFLLLPFCVCGLNFTIYATNISFPISSNSTPDNRCYLTGDQKPGFEYRAIVMLSNRRNLSAMFPSGAQIRPVNGGDMTQTFNGIFSWSNVTNINGTVVGPNEFFWSGADDFNFTTSQRNCADFTDNDGDAWVKVGRLDQSSELVGCNESYRFLCVKGQNFSSPTTSSSLNDVFVFLSNSKEIPRSGFDPDAYCQNQSQSSYIALKNWNISNVQAVAFNARRQNLQAMFPANSKIYDVDGNFLARDSTELFARVSSLPMRDSAGYLHDTDTKFWTGSKTDDDSGTKAGVTCGDYTGSPSSTGEFGTLRGGIYDYCQGCNEAASFLCAANVIKPQPVNGTPGATLVYFSPPLTIQELIDSNRTADEVCQREVNNAPAGAKLVGRKAIALTINATNIDSNAVVEDLHNNTLAQSLSNFLFASPMTTRSLTTVNGIHVDIDEFFWFGANICANFTNASSALVNGTNLRRNDKSSQCNIAAPFLCAALAPPRPSSTANATWNGTTVVLVVQGNSTNGTIQVTISPDIVFGQNGSVQVVVTGNNNNTISSVVSVVFRNGSGSVVNVTNLTNPITVTFPIQNDLADVQHCVDTTAVNAPLFPQCGYFNENTSTWETDGCSVSSIDSTWVQCSCTHLTDFAMLAPKSNKIVPTDTLDLTPDNVATNYTGLVAVMVILAIFGVVFVLAWRKDGLEAAEYAELRAEKQEKWSNFMAERKKTTLVKQIKIAFQKRHTWFSLVFRKTGTSFKSVDRTFVALLSVFASMSMSALFHAQSNENVTRVVAWIVTVCVCLVPSQILMALFVHTGQMGFYEEWEYSTRRRRNKCLAYRFPENWRILWRVATLLLVIFMIVFVLTMSMQFDRQPFYYCQGAPAKAWVLTWISAYAITVFGYEPLRLLFLAIAKYYLERGDALKNEVEIAAAETIISHETE